MFAKKSDLKDRIVKAILTDRSRQKAVFDREKKELEDRLRGEFELILQAKEAQISLLQTDLESNEKFVKDVEDIYAFVWDLINKNTKIANYFVLQKEKMEKHFGYIFQSLGTTVDEIETLRRTMLDKDPINRERLKYNAPLISNKKP